MPSARLNMMDPSVLDNIGEEADDDDMRKSTERKLQD